MNTGDLLLRLAMLMVAISGALFLLEWRGRRVAAASWAFVAHTGMLVGASVLLWSHFLLRHYEYTYVSQYSSRDLSPALTFAAFWAGQEGSILLWTLIAALIGLALMRQPGALARPAMALVSLGQIALLALLMVRSPFATSPITPPDGRGLNPLLEDPWMIIHPPVLFVGYASLLIPFALAAVALYRRDYRDWNRAVWPWTLFAVVTLGLGIALGGVWAYKVLGWGGYWGWDPVENASLIPWLVAVGLLHGLLIQRTTGSLTRTNMVLAFLGWLTVLGGTYLTRSGVLSDFSVHSFAESGLNAPLQITMLVFGVLALGFLLARWQTVEGGNPIGTAISRESALWLGMMTVLTLGALVAVGTAAPLLTSLLGQPGNVRPEYYANISLPLGIALVVLMGLSPALRWYRQQGSSLLAGLWPGLIGGGVLVAAVLFAGLRDPGYVFLVAVTGAALAVNLVVALKLFRRGWKFGAGYLGHVGIAIMVLGMAISTSFGKSQKLELAQGRTVSALGYDLTLNGFAAGERGGQVLDIAVTGDNWTLAARPALIPSPQGEGTMHKPAISGWRELYLSPLEVHDHADDEPVWLEKGKRIEFGEARYTFTGFRMESHDKFLVRADLVAEYGGHRYEIAPSLEAGGGNTLPVDAEVPGLGNVSIARIDADQGRVALRLPGGATHASLAIVELSTKPFINLVWFGVLLTLFGTVMAGIRRAAEQRVAPALHGAAKRGEPRRSPAPKGKRGAIANTGRARARPA